jgi:hypothetical protein
MGGLFTTSKKLTDGGEPSINDFVLDWSSIHRAIPLKFQLEAEFGSVRCSRARLPRQYCLSSRRGRRSR